MSFVRFEPGTVDWRAPIQVQQNAAAEGVGHDPRIDEVRAAIEIMEQSHRPPAVSETQWFALLRDTRHIGENWLDIALLCGWDLIHLFGSPPVPRGRVGLMGVALLLDGRVIEAIDQDRIVIVNRLGPPNLFRRHTPECSEPFDWTGSDLIWNVINREEWQ